MANAYVYAPFTKVGNNPVRTHDNNSCQSGQQMVDLYTGLVHGIAVRFYASPAVQSARFTRVSGCAPNCNIDLQNGVKVDLYSGLNGTGTNFGWVLYGHLASRISDGVRSSTYGLTVGYVVDDPNNCAYYSGEHVHMEAIGGARMVSNSTNSFHAGSTPIYLFFW